MKNHRLFAVCEAIESTNLEKLKRLYNLGLIHNLFTRKKMLWAGSESYYFYLKTESKKDALSVANFLYHNLGVAFYLTKSSEGYILKTTWSLT